MLNNPNLNQTEIVHVALISADSDLKSESSSSVDESTTSKSKKKGFKNCCFSNLAAFCFVSLFVGGVVYGLYALANFC